MNDPIGILEIEANTSVPIWFINHYLDVTASNYLKLVSLREICWRFMDGADDQDFEIAASSFELYPGADNPSYDRERVVVLESKDHSAKNFWRLFRHLHRPIILFRGRPVFDLHSEAALKIPKLILNSPVDLNLEGNAAALSDLVRGRTFAVRDNETVGVAIENIRSIVETSHLIEDPRTPEGVRHWASEQVEGLMNKQNEINAKLGIRRARIYRKPRR